MTSESQNRPDARGLSRGGTEERSARRTRRARPTAAVVFLAAFAAVYLLAVCTPAGQRAENSLVVGYADQARVFAMSESVGLPPLTAEYATIGAGIALIALVALVRRRWREGGAAVGVVVVSLVGAEALRSVLPRPDLVHAPSQLTEVSFPSGHVAIAAGLALGAALVASPRTRPYVVAAGALWLAVTAGGVQALYWHRPSDALGATLLACACYALATRLLPPTARSSRPGAGSRSRVLPAVALAVAALGAVLGSAREDAVARPLVFAAAAFACALLIWWTAVRSDARTAVRSDVKSAGRREAPRLRG
ncbi:phosphatase PAP2 family protein [Streptomyces laurentii]|uniref:phosphatase PAP2 family protein n=1 Tax=Streptomyces laurentii TaxID=39478 RepID=UPI0036C7BDD0